MAKKQKPKSGTATISFKPGIETLENRTMPDATVLTRQPDYGAQDGFVDILADAKVEVLGSSGDGRFLLLQSKATNLARIDNPGGNPLPQVSAPGQTNIFWLEKLDGAISNIRLVSSYDPPANNNGGFAAGQKGLGVAESVPGQFLNAVISDDGQTIAFLSGANAALFDAQLYEASGFGVDAGGLDAFTWSNVTGRVTLASRAVSGFAMGASGNVANPAVAPDGKVISFVSTFSAQQATGRFAIAASQTALFVE